MHTHKTLEAFSNSLFHWSKGFVTVKGLIFVGMCE